jgi:hypothetical protein
MRCSVTRGLASTYVEAEKGKGISAAHVALDILRPRARLSSPRTDAGVAELALKILDLPYRDVTRKKRLTRDFR